MSGPTLDMGRTSEPTQLAVGSEVELLSLRLTHTSGTHAACVWSTCCVWRGVSEAGLQLSLRRVPRGHVPGFEATRLWWVALRFAYLLL